MLLPKERLYTFADIEIFTGVTELTLKRWMEQTEETRSAPLRNIHRFTAMEVIGFQIAQLLSVSKRGCVVSFRRKIVEAFSAFSEDKLIEQFDDEKYFFMSVHQASEKSRCIPILIKDEYEDSINVKVLYDALVKRLNVVPCSDD